MAAIGFPTWPNIGIGAVVYLAIHVVVQIVAYEYRRWRVTRRRHRARLEAPSPRQNILYVSAP